MKTLFILMNHTLTLEQEEDAKENLKIEKFVNIADAKWSDIDPFEKSVVNVINIYKDRLTQQASAGDVLLVQGDFGATYNMINFAKNIGIKTIYATTKRIAQELTIDGKLVTRREFKHEKFREYL